MKDYFYTDNPWNAANRLAPMSHHEGHFGLLLRSANGDNGVEIDTVEHARLLIAELESAIAEGELFTEAQLAEFHTHASDTRESIRRRMKLS